MSGHRPWSEIRRPMSHKERTPRSLPVELGPKGRGDARFIFAGPYRDKPDAMYGVKLAREINRPCWLDVPARDFGTPDPKVLSDAIVKTARMLLLGKPVYAGCAFGQGRAGVFLSALVLALGCAPRTTREPDEWIDADEGPAWDAVAYVRGWYNEKAVETPQQYAYLRSLRLGPIRRRLWWLRLRDRLGLLS